MSRIVIPARTRLVYVESRGWLLVKLGIKILVIAGVIFVWSPLVAGRPHTMRLVGWLLWAAIVFLAVGAVVRIAEAVWGVGLTACVLVRSLAEAVVWWSSALERGARSLMPASRADGCGVCHRPARLGLGQREIEELIRPDVRRWSSAGPNGPRAPIGPHAVDGGKGGGKVLRAKPRRTRLS